ncbi:MAG: CrcB family protein, partial [Thiogranum sp.]
MNQVLAIAGGGAVGAVLRYWVSSGVYALTGRGFPYGTLVVNVLGSVVMGFLYVWLLERMP